VGLLAIAGSTALILFAIRFLRKGLDRLLGTRLGALAAGQARSPARGFLAGTAMAAIAPSSSSMAAVVSRLALEERIAPPTALTLMLGANVGLTSLVLLGAAGLESCHPLLLVAGVVLFQFTRSETSRGIGQVVLSLGFVLLGLALTKQAVPLLGGGDADLLLGVAANHPLALAVAAALLTVALQSSSVTILLLMCLTAQHPFGLDAVLAAVAGANFGLIGTALAIAWGEPRSRLIALGNAALKGSVSLAAILGAAAASPWLRQLPGDAHTAAGAHLCLALLAAAIGLLAGPALLARLGRTRLAGHGGDEQPTTRYLALEVGGDTRLAMANSRREILHASETARAMLDQVWRAWSTGDRALAKGVARLDDRIDLLDREIKAHLARCGGDGEPAAERERLCQLRYVTQLEAIGDVIEKQLAELIAEGARHAEGMPADCRLRLDATCQAVQRTLLTAETAFATRDQDLARRLLESKSEIAALVRSERDRSLWRRREGVGYNEEAIYLDLLDGLERINRCACTVGRDILESPQAAAASAVA
jgi:phosphate:Na+ symporter